VAAKHPVAARTAFDLPRAPAHELHRRKHVRDRLRKHFLSLLRQAIADREQHIAAAGEIRSPELKCTACARLPTAAVGGNKRGKRPRARRQIKVAEQRQAVMGVLGTPGAVSVVLRYGHCCSSKGRGHSLIASAPCAVGIVGPFVPAKEGTKILDPPIKFTRRKRGWERTEP